MKPADLLLVAAVVCAASAVAVVSVAAGLGVAAVLFTVLWWLLDDEVSL